MNKAILMGRLTKDPELRYTPGSNLPVCTFTLAVERRTARQGEQNNADFISIVAWRATAEFCSKYFRRGLRVSIYGHIHTRFWDDEQGKRHYVTEIIAEEAYFADANPNNTHNSHNTQYQQPAANNQQINNKPQPPAGNQPKPNYYQNDGFYALDEEDDLPF